MTPPAAVLIHLPAQQLDPCCLQLPHSAGEIVHHKADHRSGGEVLVVLVAGAEHLEGAALRELEGGEVGLLLAGGQPEDRLEECPRAGYSLVLVPTQPMQLTRILVAPSLRSLASAILPPRSWLSEV